MKATGSPVLVRPEGPAVTLERVALGAGLHDEAWLQALIFDHPELLPVSRIEPGFGAVVPVAREVTCGHGSIDNLYLTPSGEIILVETKLWRNVQARREVVAQALDYVSALMRTSYADFEAAVLQAAGNGSSLYTAVADALEPLEESAFIDAVSRNLARGRMLVIVLGDGIRAEAEALAGLLQSHAGAHFTFALVELATWRNSETGDILAIPNTLSQTVMIERGILLFGDAGPRIEPVPEQAVVGPKSISEEMFFEALAARDPQFPSAVREFLKLVEPLGVFADLRASLNLKVELPDTTRPTNFGYIQKNGQLWTSPFAWTAPEEIALRYNARLAQLINGQVATHDSIYLSTNGRSAPLIGQLLPAHADAWAALIKETVAELRSAPLPTA